MKPSVRDESTPDLLAELVQLSKLKKTTIDLVDTPACNRLTRQLGVLGEELLRRPDPESELSSLLDHEHPAVRFQAAVVLLKLNQAKARPIIQAIADSGHYPFAGHVGVFLSMYDGVTSKIFRASATSDF